MTQGNGDEKKSGRGDATVTDRGAVREMFAGFDGDDPQLVAMAASAVLANAAASTRAAIGARLGGGGSYGGDRDIYEALGYKKEPDYRDYLTMYRRHEVARAVVNKPVTASWRRPPEIVEIQNAGRKKEETQFERAWKDLATKLKLWHYFERVDRLSRIGEHAVLLVGYDDGARLEEPVESAKKVLFVQAYGEGTSKVVVTSEDPKDPRFGRPTFYSLDVRGVTGTKRVHHSRIIHVSGDNLENDVAGTPALESVFNRLIDIERVAGASGEMYWRGAFVGFGLKVDKDANVGAQTLTQLKDEMELFIHGLQRYIRLRGVSIEQLAPQVYDPSKHIDAFVRLIALGAEIPKRILEGSERGELSSAQDERAWNDTVESRQKRHCEDKIIRPFVDGAVIVGALPPTGDEGYICPWPGLLEKSEKDTAEVGAIRSKSLRDYVDADGADTIVPPKEFLTEVWGLSDEKAELIIAAVDDQSREANGGEDDDDV